eukprot:gene27032-biopygen17599
MESRVPRDTSASYVVRQNRAQNLPLSFRMP